ncbi:MAG: EthD family reductase [Candidatus Rokubacteria bacterium]|nr:EthD family reductase [Candidatus Rokubacteria bacterium]
MIRVSVFYPQKDSARFDHDYYRQKHMTLVGERLTNITPQMQIREIVG